MSITKLVAKNTAIQLVGKGLSTVLGIAVVALITRALLPEGFGQYTKVITFLSFFGIIADLGLTLITAQMISEQGADENKIIRTIFSFRVISALAIFAIAPVVAIWTPYAPIVKFGIALTAASFFFVSLQQTLVGLFQKHLVMQYPMIAENIGRVVLLGVTVFAAWRGENLLWYLAAVVAGNFANLIATYFFSKRYISLGFAWDREIISDMWKRSMPIAISIIFNLVYLKADMLILSFVRPDSEVGLYGAAYRVIDILMMVPVMLMGVILPIATRAWSAGEGDRVERVLQKTFDAFVLYAMPTLFGGLILAAPVMKLIAGSGFISAAQPMRVLLFAFVCATFSTLFGHFIVALQKQRSVIWVYGTDALLALIAYMIFVPKFGMYGAGWATVGSELYAAIILGFIVLRTTAARLNMRIFWRAAVATAVMCVGVMSLAESALPVMIVIFGGVLLYGATLGLLRVHKILL